MRKIKFRGLSAVNGQYVYGNYLTVGGTEYIYEETHPFFTKGDLHEIKSGSAAEFLDNDCNGREVYEADKLRHPLTGIRSRAHIKRVAAIQYNELEN